MEMLNFALIIILFFLYTSLANDFSKVFIKIEKALTLLAKDNKEWKNILFWQP